MFFLINMCGSSLVPWALEHWKHSSEEKADQDGRVVS